MNKPTLVIGAGTNPGRYAYRAIGQLKAHQHTVYALGKENGEVLGVPIDHGKPDYKDIHTVTLYINPTHQPQYYDYIIGLKPSRVIFNPGTENEEFESLLREKGIASEESCTLVMLSIGVF
jgi:predicted CoA-binding protein